MSDQGQGTGQNSKGRNVGRRLAIIGLSMLAAAGVTGGALGLQTSKATTSPAAAAAATKVAVHPTPAELAQWRTETATPFQRALIVQKMQAAFAGVADVGVGPLPNHHNATDAVSSATPLTEAASHGTTHVAQLVLAYGISGDHFWVTASYGDMARGAIWVAVQACTNYYHVPGWICSTAGNILSSWSYGWGTGNNHGVWAAVYWWPPHVTGGRW